MILIIVKNLHFQLKSIRIKASWDKLLLQDPKRKSFFR